MLGDYMIYGFNNIPAEYDYKNVYNSSMNPSVVHTNSNLTWYFRKYLLQKILSVFKFDNLPESWSENYFLYSLFVFGYVAVINNDDFGIIPQHCTLSGYDVFYQPNRVIVTNPLIKKQEYKLHEDSELVLLQPDYSGVWDIVTYYADLLSLASESLAMNFVNSKLAYVFFTENKSVAESFKKMFDVINSGSPAAFVDKNLLDENGNPNWVMFSQNLKENYIANDILENLAMIDSRFNTEIGIPNVNIAKKSGVTDAEVNANNYDTESKVIIWLKMLRNSLALVNNKYDLNITADLRYEVKNEWSEIINTRII